MTISSKVWNTVIQALENHQVIEILYRNWNGEKTSRVAPAHLENLQGDWYLFVQDEGFNNFRQIAVEARAMLA